MGNSSNRRKRFAVVGAVLALSLLAPMLASGSGVGAGHPPIIRLRQGTSSNWSGYAAFGGAGSFTSVTGSWTQPSVVCTATKTYSSYWVGLDGYNDSTVEQLGTEGDCVNGIPRYYAWFEMYPHPSNLVGLTVTPSHIYSASVTSAGRGTFALRLTDVTTGTSFSTLQKLNQAQASSAEVIVEAPFSGGVLPLANFGSVNFSATTANTKPLGSFSNLDRITMTNPYGMKSTPSTFDSTGTSFSVNWSSS